VKQTITETLFWTTFENNIAYLNVDTIDLNEIGDSDNSVEHNKALLAETLDEVMEYFADVDGVIIYVRHNLGGGDFVITMIHLQSQSLLARYTLL
jgi:carboxyl-terminal processing protease